MTPWEKFPSTLWGSMACLYRKEACYQQQYYGGGVVSGPRLGWAVSSALSVALRIQTLHPAACWTSKHGSWMQMEVRLQTPTVRGRQHFADWIAEFRGILKMVPSSSQSLPKGSYRAPHRGCRAAPEQSLPLDGATGVLVQVDSIFQEDGDWAQDKQGHYDHEGNFHRAQC